MFFYESENLFPFAINGEMGNQKLFDGYRAYGNASSQGGGMVPSSEEEAMGGDMDW